MGWVSEIPIEQLGGKTYPYKHGAVYVIEIEDTCGTLYILRIRRRKRTVSIRLRAQSNVAVLAQKVAAHVWSFFRKQWGNVNAVKILYGNWVLTMDIAGDITTKKAG